MITLNKGEIKLDVNVNQRGKLTLASLGLTQENLFLEGGVLRMVLNIEQANDIHFASHPTVELKYSEKMEETHWSVEFNGATVLDKYDHSGNATLLLLKRDAFSDIHRHENQLIIHAQFTSGAHINPEESFITLF